jgi:hypothetical protein
MNNEIKKAFKKNKGCPLMSNPYHFLNPTDLVEDITQTYLHLPF